MYGGINTSVSYKGIALSLGFTYKIGGDLYDGAYMDVADDGYYWERIRAKATTTTFGRQTIRTVQSPVSKV